MTKTININGRDVFLMDYVPNIFPRPRKKKRKMTKARRWWVDL